MLTERLNEKDWQTIAEGSRDFESIVEKIVEDFKANKKDNEDFWIKMGDQYVLVRYFAVRNENNEYLGVLEVTQNIKPIQEITGEKRLLSE